LTNHLNPQPQIYQFESRNLLGTTRKKVMGKAEQMPYGIFIQHLLSHRPFS